MLKPALKMSQKLHKLNTKPPLINKRMQQANHLLAPPPTPAKRLTTTLNTQANNLTSTSSTPSSASASNSSTTTSSTASPHFPDHLRCGEVFTWHCEGEFYAVECRLCDDHPLCPLSEFPLHMEAWHTDWSGKLTIDGEELEAEEDEEEDQNDLYHVLALSPLNEDSGLCEYDHEHSSSYGSGAGGSHNSSKSCDDEENLLEPFEQVLIEQDNTVDTTQINVDEDEEAEVLSEIISEAGENAVGVAIAVAVTVAEPSASTLSSSSSSSSSAAVVVVAKNNDDSHQPQQQQQLAIKPKQTNTTQEITLKTPLSPQKLTQTTKQINDEHSLSQNTSRETVVNRDQREQRDHGELKQIKEFANLKTNDHVLHSEHTVSLNDDDLPGNVNIINKENETTTSCLSVGTQHTSWDVSQNKVEESFTQEVKQEITAGEIVQMPSPQPDLQHYKISTNQITSDDNPANNVSINENLSITDITKQLPNSVEITNVEILKFPLNVKTQKTTTNNTKSKAQRAATKRKRKADICQQQETKEIKTNPETPTSLEIDNYITSLPKSIDNSSPASSLSPQESDKYLQTFEKFLDTKISTTETESSESIDEAYCSPSSKTSKKRRTLSRACKKPAKDCAVPDNNSQTSHHLQNQTINNFPLTPMCTNSPETLTTTELPNNTCEKASKIRCLVKQCERIAREHKQTAVETASVTSKSSKTTGKSRSRRRRSLTPVEVCDILPTIPLNDYTITYYDDTENMSPESLSEHLESLACSLLDYDDFPDDDQSVASSPSTDDIIGSSPSSPGSPKTEEEHFEFIEPKEKLNRIHVLELIELYKEHTRLWDQTHTEFCEPHLCRESWQDITRRWNVFCNRSFTITEVRIRISTLCQRYLKERERIQREGELDESAKFPYYEQMLFLEQHRSLQKRREIYEQQNEKILEIYRKYLVLWHVRCYKVRQVKERTKAFQIISDELKEMGIYLSSTGVQKRIRSLRKCYRLEKIRHLHAQVERLPFEPTFKHYERMQFLDKHIDPFVCRICGKIFESLVGFKEHVETVNHGNILEEEDEDDEQDVDKSEAPVQEKDAVVCGINEKYEISMGTKDGSSVSVFIKPLAVAEEVGIYTSATGCDNNLSKLPMEDDIIEKLIENVSNESEFATKTLDKYLHSNDSSEDMSFYMGSANVSLADLIMPENPTKQMVDDMANEGLLDGGKKSEVIPKFEGSSKYSKTKAFGIDEEYHSGDGDTQSTRLNDDEIRCMISIYRKYRQLWDPNHLDYNSRNLRRQAWFNLTTEYNKAINRNFSWRSLYRKLIDYAKYYKKLSGEQQQPHEVKWTFYKDLMFLDDVIAVNTELQKSMHLRDITLKVIEIYKNLPQLWNIRDPDFNKRPVKQRNTNVLCNRVQEATNMQINPERIKNRIIELRTAYRAAKKKRLKCLKTKQKFFPDFEFYEEFSFIDAHIDPFQCDLCCMDFKKLTDFNRHIRTEHEPKRRRFRNDPDNNKDEEVRNFENVCHICGVKFSNRGNLAHHLQRHEGTRNFECSTCLKKFYTSHSLKIHVRTHTKECPYICEKCGLSFVNASKLNQHVLRHTNKKDFKCDHCPKTFYTAFEKNRHTRWHLNIRDKNCPICGKSFVKGSSYYAHLMLHSDKKRFECDKCDRKFAQYAGLYKHKKRYHST